MNSEERQAYFRAVILAVYNKEPEEARVSNLEWEMVRLWMDRDIPLATVLQAIEQMEKHPSVRYIEQAVEDEESRRIRALGAG